MEQPPTNGPGDDTPAHERPRHIEPPADLPFDGTPLEQATAQLRHVFADADARGEAITLEDAQAVASLLCALLGASEMRRFARTGDGDILALQTECHYLKSRTWETPDVDLWVERFEQYLAARDEPAAPAKETQPDNPQIEQGVREHGGAFRAYLQLSDVDPHQGDLLQTFHESYIGMFASMDALLDELTEIRNCLAALNEVAASWGFDGLVSLDRASVERIAREAWDIVDVEGRLYVFHK